MTVRIVKVIYCDEGRAGAGTPENMVRRLPGLYTIDGTLICQYDAGPQENSPVRYVNELALRQVGEA